ncbi:MAG TPA: hypothetical protein V6D30_17060 [Leptolyngbyaceae cyanobacterium]
MIANAPPKSSRVDYILSSTQNGWKLTVWEPAAVTQRRRRPFLWKFGAEFRTLKEAHSILQVLLDQEQEAG